MHQPHGRAQDLRLLALGEDDPLAAVRAPRAVREVMPDLLALAQPDGQLLAVGVQVKLLARHAGRHRRGRHRRRHPLDQPGVQRLGHDVLGAEAQALQTVGAQHAVGHVLPRQRGQGVRGRHLHLLVDRARPHVQRAAEDEREAQHVVDLVGVVRAAGGDDGVGPRGARQLVVDLRVGVGHRKDQRPLRHRRQHLGFQHVGGREAVEHVRPRHRVGQRPGARFRRRSVPCTCSCSPCGRGRSPRASPPAGCARGAPPAAPSARRTRSRPRPRPRCRPALHRDACPPAPAR